MSEIDLNNEAIRNLFDQIMNIYVFPYVKKKQEKKLLSENIVIKAFQIVTDPNKKTPEIRINHEVRWLIDIKLKEGILKNKGDEVKSDEIEENYSYEGELFEEEKNFSHITMFMINDHRWVISYNLIFNIPESERLLSISNEYIEAAKYSHKKNNKYAAVGVLFHACELAIRSSMLSFPLWGMSNRLELQSHSAVSKKYNDFSKVFPAHSETVIMFNDLMKLRNDARYGKNELTINNNEITRYIELTEKLIKNQNYLLHKNAPD